MKLVTALTLLGVVADRASVALAKGPSFGRPRPMGHPFSMEDALAMDATAAGAGTVDRRQSDKYGTEAFFDQLIDHKNPSLGTFKQRYWYNAKHYAGPGSPIIMYNAGESDAKVFTGYMSNWTMSGLLAQNVGGAAIVIEHRYWGKSSPYSVLTIANLTHLNVDNAIADMTRFAREAELPFAPKAATDPSKAPWVLFGTSYSGSLAVWTERLDPGVFWAYYGSSATVHQFGNFWQYFRPVQLGMPRNCSADVNRVLAKIDSILLNGTAGDRTALKTRFGLQTIEDLDFADALAKGPYQWQYTDYSTGYGDFYQWCDYVENAHPKAYPNAKAPGPDGVGADKALEGYARWVKEVLIPGTCDSDDMVDCFGKLDPNNTWYTNFTVSFAGGNRQWQWLVCNEPLQSWPNGAPEGYPTLHSRLIQMPYQESGCRLMFREQKVGDKAYSYGTARGLTADDVNRRTLGGFAYAKPTQRLLYVNGEFDPWLDETVSSMLRPGGPMRSTDAQPVLILPEGGHATDMLVYMGDYNAGAKKVQEQAMAIMVEWVKEHPSMKGR